MMGNLTWDPEWQSGSKYLEEILKALQAKIEALVAKAQRHIGEGRLRYTLIGKTVDQADVKYRRRRTRQWSADNECHQLSSGSKSTYNHFLFKTEDDIP
ncbi:unnamed protein product [Caretta caretta]